MRQKVENAINSVIRPYLRSLGMDISLVSVTGDSITVQIINEPESIMRISLRAAISVKIRELVPEVISVDFR
jgi:Fe-S cluster biogenesis protein NfuA